jgi:hypothetical protein
MGCIEPENVLHADPLFPIHCMVTYGTYGPYAPIRPHAFVVSLMSIEGEQVTFSSALSRILNAEPICTGHQVEGTEKRTVW